MQLHIESSRWQGRQVLVSQRPLEGLQDWHDPLHWTGAHWQVVASRVWQGGQASVGHSQVSVAVLQAWPEGQVTASQPSSGEGLR